MLLHARSPSALALGSSQMIFVQVCSLIFLALLKETDMITPEEAYRLIKKKYPDKFYGIL